MLKYKSICLFMKYSNNKINNISGKIFNMGQTQSHFVYFRPFLNKMTIIEQNLIIKIKMVCLGFKPVTSRW